MLKKTFINFINKGSKAAEMITDTNAKATVYAELAKAIAMSGLLLKEDIKSETEEIQEEVKEEAKATTKKESLEKTAGKGKKKKEEIAKEITPTKEEVKEEAKEEVKEEISAAQVPETLEDNTWSEENQAKYAEHLEALNQFVSAWGEDSVYGEIMNIFSEGTFTGGENILPSNIEAFVIFLMQLSEQQE